MALDVQLIDAEPLAVACEMQLEETDAVDAQGSEAGPKVLVAFNKSAEAGLVTFVGVAFLTNMLKDRLPSESLARLASLVDPRGLPLF